MNRRAFLAAAAAAIAGPSIARAQVSASDPLRAAEEISGLEAKSYIPQFYAYYATMHPDAQAIIPRRVVHTWYAENFWPRGPRPAVATGVTWLDTWTWGVTGKQYRNVAEVSYYQEFDDGSVDNDVVRIINQNGQWHWWFGRSYDFVQGLNDRTNQMLSVPEAGDAPDGLANLTALDETSLDSMPARIIVPGTGDRFARSGVEGSGEPGNTVFTPLLSSSYDPVPHKEFGSVYLKLSRFNVGATPAEQLRKVVEWEQDYPFATISGWNTAPATGLPWVEAYLLGFDVVGQMWSTTLVNETYALNITAYEEDAFRAICHGIGNPTPVH